MVTHDRSAFVALLLVVVFVLGILLIPDHAAVVTAQATPPVSYGARTDRLISPEPALPSLGPAGHRFIDPAFGSRLVRVTDPETRPGFPGRSFTSASAAHSLTWSAASDRFYIRSVDGTYIPYAFNQATMTPSRIQPAGTGNGGLTIVSQVEPQFSFLSSTVLYGSRQDPVEDWPIVRKFDFATMAYSDILNLGSITTVPNFTYAGALSSSATLPEKLAVMFGGSQDTHYKVAVFQVSPAGTNARILDTRASTITVGGVTNPTSIALGFFLHHAWIDQSGSFVVLYPVAQSPAPFFIWNLSTNAITPVTQRATGHDATGFQSMVNQSCCTSSPEDAAQWQWRSLSAPATTRDLISPVVRPQEIFLADHTSWNNAQPGLLVPILSSLYRYFDGTLNTTPWRPWDDEVIAIETAVGGNRVWRFAHHRSNIAPDGSGSAATYFWYLPRAIISPNGRWAIFTSNWEKTLGSTVGSDVEPGGGHRADVFLVELSKSFTDDPLTTGTQVKAVHFTELRTRIDALRAIHSLTPFSWTDPGLAPGTLVRAIHLTEMRNALLEAYAAAGVTPGVFTDPSIPPGVVPIRAEHIQQLRDSVLALEAH